MAACHMVFLSILSFGRSSSSSSSRDSASIVALLLLPCTTAAMVLNATLSPLPSWSLYSGLASSPGVSRVLTLTFGFVPLEASATVKVPMISPGVTRTVSLVRFAITRSTDANVLWPRARCSAETAVAAVLLP